MNDSTSDKMITDTNKSRIKVSLRGGFSDRMGIKPENRTMQMNDFDQRTRVQMINTIKEIIHHGSSFQMNDDYQQRFIRGVLRNVYQQEVDSSDYYHEQYLINIVTETIRNDDYDSVLTLIEYICNAIPHYFSDPFMSFNQLFEREYVGYRFVNGMITPITDKIETQAIEKALKDSPSIVRKHTKKALEKLSSRENPDYENSIKESISAVEVECNILTGEQTTLGKALQQLEKKGITIHPALKRAFDNLYGYASNANGIRHAGDIDGAGATFAEAEFMLVACSAFVNYLLICQVKQTRQGKV